MKLLFISDFFVSDLIGGAELVDDTVIKYLQNKFPLIRKKSMEVTKDDLVRSDFIILSNISMLNQNFVDFIKTKKKYIILEHDYKIHVTRHPWRFKNSIIPQNERINYDLYENAVAVFVQTKDHLDVMLSNEVKANFINLECSIWSDTELNYLKSFINKTNKSKNFAIVNSKNWIKNTQGAIEFCKVNKLDYDLINTSNYQEFIRSLANYSTLVFFPIARETCCRLIVEARCLGLNVITTSNSGAFMSNWFSKKETDLLEYLHNQSIMNLEKIKSFCE